MAEHAREGEGEQTTSLLGAVSTLKKVFPSPPKALTASIRSVCGIPEYALVMDISFTFEDSIAVCDNVVS